MTEEVPRSEVPPPRPTARQQEMRDHDDPRPAEYLRFAEVMRAIRGTPISPRGGVQTVDLYMNR